MSDPLAYFLTWPTYGSWLNGDERGSVDREHNQPGTPVLNPNAERKRGAAQRMRGPSVVLDESQRGIVADAIGDHCRYRGWELFALAARTNHVHVVIANSGTAPERTMAEFKTWCTRRLREAGTVPATERIWVRHGSTRYLWTARSVESAIAYVEIGQDAPQ